MVAAVFAARNGREVAIAEANEIPGKKLLATGNGKCNFTNQLQRPDCYRGEQPLAAMELLKRYDTKRILAFFEELGIYPKERNGYWYPNSEQAASVREVLEAELVRLGVTIYRNTHIDNVFREGNGFRLTASCRDWIKPSDNARQNKKETKKPGKPVFSEPYTRELIADYLILAAGGSAGNIRGADGSGYRLAKQLGLDIITPVPALVQLKAEGYEGTELAGVRTEAALQLSAEGERYHEKGEILFTEYGISGIPVMQLSRYASVVLNRRKTQETVELSLDFFSVIEENKLIQQLEERFRHLSSRTAAECLTGLLPSKLNAVLLTRAAIQKKRQLFPSEWHKLKILAAQMKHFAMKITGTNSFENAQVAAGGVSLSELEIQTMEAKKIKNLYIIGELADIDGTCGGYNLQWAWMSAMAAAEGIGRRETKQ